MPFDISKLDKRITIQRQIKTASDGQGGFTSAWTATTSTPIWCAIWPRSVKETMQDQQPAGEITHRIRIRFRRGVSAQMRVQYKNRYFNIVGPPVNVNEDNEWLDLLCKEVG